MIDSSYVTAEQTSSLHTSSSSKRDSNSERRTSIGLLGRTEIDFNCMNSVNSNCYSDDDANDSNAAIAVIANRLAAELHKSKCEVDLLKDKVLLLEKQQQQQHTDRSMTSTIRSSSSSDILYKTKSRTSSSDTTDMRALYRNRITSIDIDYEIDAVAEDNFTNSNSISSSSSSGTAQSLDRQLIDAILCSDIIMVTTLLTAYPKLIRTVNEVGHTCLHVACIECKHECIKVLLLYGANVNAQDISGRSPLHLCNDPSIIRQLCEHDADTNIIDNYGLTPLHTHIMSNKIENVIVLIEFYANCMLQVPKHGRNCLHLCAELCNYDILAYILQYTKHRDSIDSSDRDGNTALHIVCACENTIGCQQKIFMLLLNYGASVSATNNHGITPLHLICGNRYMCTNMLAEPLVEMILSLSGNPNAKDSEGCTPLVVACAHREWDICKQLIIAGGDINIPCTMSCRLLDQEGKNGGKTAEKIDLGECTTSDLMPRAQRYRMFPYFVVPQTPIDKDKRDRCMNCAALFNHDKNLSIFTLRSGKHHCRACGRLVCQDCSSNSISREHMPEYVKEVSSERKMRVCIVCYTIITTPVQT